MYLNNRSIAIINAWLEETQSATSQAHQHPASNTRNQSRVPTPSPSSSRQEITLASAEGIAMNSPKRNADHDAAEPSTPKRRQILTHSDNTPHAGPVKMYVILSVLDYVVLKDGLISHFYILYLILVFNFYFYFLFFIYIFNFIF